MSILILSDRVDKWLILHRRRPSIVPRVHNANRLSQLPENSLAKAQKTKSPAPQKQAMLAPNHHACPGHEDAVPCMNPFEEEPWPISPQNRQALALEPDVFHLILKYLVAEPADGD